MFRKGQLRRLRKRSSSLFSFPLRHGGRYYYDAERAGEQLWVHCIGLLRVKYSGEIPGSLEEPEIQQKIRAAKDPIAAIEPFRPVNPERALVDPLVILKEPSESDLEAAETVPDLSDTPD